jgi:predicted anti-sigma-YlaC factor YlaD
MSRLQSLWHLLNLPCEGMSRLASESLDRELGRTERIALRSHLLYCVACRRYARQIRLLRTVLRRLAERLETNQPLPGPGLTDEMRERIKRTLRPD